MLTKRLVAALYGAMLVAGMFTFTGCETVKGTITGPINGMQKDAENVGNLWDKAKKADDWMQKNMW